MSVYSRVRIIAGNRLMSNGFRARKLGMTQIFNADGTVIPVSILELLNHQIIEKKPMADGTVQVLFAVEGIKKRKNKSSAGQRSKYNIQWENFSLFTYRIEEKKLKEIEKYENLVDSLFDSKKIDVTGTSKGKGTQGTMKKFGFKGQPASHGNSKAHRLAGGMGGCQDPGRVTIGKKQAGRMGNQQKTVKNLKVVEFDKDRKLIFVQGAVTGNKKSIVAVKRSFGHGSLHENYPSKTRVSIQFQRTA